MYTINTLLTMCCQRQDKETGCCVPVPMPVHECFYQLFLWNVLLHSIQNHSFIIYHLIHSIKYTFSSATEYALACIYFGWMLFYFSSSFSHSYPCALGRNFMISFILLDIYYFIRFGSSCFGLVLWWRYTWISFAFFPDLLFSRSMLVLRGLLFCNFC